MHQTETTNQPAAALVPAVFANREAAEAAVARLRHLGLAETDIGVAVPLAAGLAGGRHIHSDPSATELASTVGTGSAVGAGLGSVGGIGLGLAAVGSAEALAIGVGGLLAAAGLSGLVWGGVLGGLLTVVTRVRRRPAADAWCEVPLGSDDVLVVARVRDWSREDRVAATLQQAGARCVLDQLALDKSWRELELEHPSGQPAPAA
jgi:hypothetical protein